MLCLSFLLPVNKEGQILKHFHRSEINPPEDSSCYTSLKKQNETQGLISK